MILVDPDDLAAHPTRDLAQLAFLIGRGLIDRTDAEIDNRSAHSSTLPGHPKWRVALGFRQELFQGFFRTPCGSLHSRRQAPHPLASTTSPDLHSFNRLQRPA